MVVGRDAPNRIEVVQLRRRLMRWYDKNGRTFPWRETDDPFKVLIAEMMLRRTRADQVVPVYEVLFEDYHSIEALADADPKRLGEILFPLGLRWRVPAFNAVARDIRKNYTCRVPDKRDDLKALSGVGDYVAGAVLSVAYSKREWIVDSNVVRVFKRYFGLSTSKEGRRDRHVIDTAKMYADSKNPRKANLALLDFGALVCTARRPRCAECPAAIRCKAMSAMKS